MGHGVGGRVGCWIRAEPLHLLEYAFAPHIAGAQAVPVLAIAPLLLIWIGFGMELKIVLAAIIAFFPVMATTTSGLRAIDKDLIDVARAFGAHRWQRIVYLDVPLAARSILAGERIAIVLAVIGAYVGELVNPDQGLGALIQLGFQNFQTPLVFVAVLALMIMSASLYAILTLLERLVIRWTE